MNLLKNFNENTSYTKLNRTTCCVCGEFNIIKTKNFDNCLQDIEFLFPFKQQLHYKNLISYEKFEADFKYTDEFSQLNDLVLEPEGFIKNKKKVKLFNIFNFLNNLIKK